MFNRRVATLGLIGSSFAMTNDAHAQGRPVIPTNYADLITMARAHVEALSYGHSGWGLGREEHWAVDLDAGAIEWTLADNMVARAPVQLIGTWASDLGSFRWGWDHPAVPAGGAPAAQAARAFAEAHAIAELLRVEVACMPETAKDFASVAVLIGDMQGLYVGQASRTALAYLGFGDVTLERAG
jgi:hypothetical protein